MYKAIDQGKYWEVYNWSSGVVVGTCMSEDVARKLCEVLNNE
jgi:hypothetical protein